MEGLDGSITAHRKALSLCPPEHPDRSIFITKLASVLLARFIQLGRVEDLEETISSYRNALNLRPPGHSRRSNSLIDLANALHIRFDHLGQIGDLEDAILHSRQGLALCPPGHTNRPFSLNNLAKALQTRFDEFGRTEDRDDAVLFHRETLTLSPPGHPHRSSFLINLANALQSRFRQLGWIEDLEDAVLSHREALNLRPPGSPYRSISLVGFANVLLARFAQFGQTEDLEDAISSHREALTLLPAGHPHRSHSLVGLANALSDRFDQFGRVEDLEDAILFHREALILRPPGHPSRSHSLVNLAIDLRAHFNQSGRIEDLEDAISSYQETLALTPPGHPGHSTSLHGLANALKDRFSRLGRTQDLEDSVLLIRKALTLRPPGHLNRSSSLNILAGALQSRFEQFGQIEDLEIAILSLREALTLRPPGHPDRSSTLRNLAVVLQAGPGSVSLRRTLNLDESFTLFEQAANDLTSTSWDRLRAALDWTTFSRHYRHRSILTAYSVSFHLLDRCLFSRPSIELQHKFLAGARIPRSLASDAASAAINAGDLGIAVEFLEQGRAILWSKIDGYRYPLDDLREVNTELADHLESLSIKLERLALSSKSGSLKNKDSLMPASLEAQMRDHRIFSEDWERTVERVRKLKGFGEFLKAVPFATLQTAAAEGPIVLINISNYRSDAIILRAHGLPMLVTLPDVRPKDLTELTEQLLVARNAGDSGNPSKYFVPILRQLWNVIVFPVVDRLIDLGVQEKSRVWWCPTAELCALPLHAAGPYRPHQKNLPDLYISSYIPTLSALIRARRNTINPAVVPKLVVVGQPGATLVKVQEEIDNIQQLGDFVDVIIGARASREIVLRGLQQHSWAHFACHGHLGDNNQPFLASFELHGGSRLTLLDLIQARLPNAELAFLSACHSAAGDLITPDETIHLAAALQFCGFRSVVGTLWAMNDQDGPDISKEFYRHIFRKPGKKADFRDSAEALDSAIREMRKNRVPIYRWIMFVHIGA